MGNTPPSSAVNVSYARNVSLPLQLRLQRSCGRRPPAPQPLPPPWPTDFTGVLWRLVARLPSKRRPAPAPCPPCPKPRPICPPPKKKKPALALFLASPPPPNVHLWHDWGQGVGEWGWKGGFRGRRHVLTPKTSFTRAVRQRRRNSFGNHFAPDACLRTSSTLWGSFLTGTHVGVLIGSVGRLVKGLGHF